MRLAAHAELDSLQPLKLTLGLCASLSILFAGKIPHGNRSFSFFSPCFGRHPPLCTIGRINLSIQKITAISGILVVSSLMFSRLPPGIHPLRGAMGLCHLLVDRRGQAVLIDTGLAGEVFFLKRLLHRLKLRPGDIQAILLTHGHLDHAGNLAAIQRLTGAAIHAHPSEQPHIDGTYPYAGTSRWCGRLEALGRRVLGYESAKIHCPLAEGDVLPFWGGLRVIHLPGHTDGHCGFYSREHDLLFSGDLFASYFFNVHLPPPILNSCPVHFPGSLRRVAGINPRLILPNHYDIPDGTLHRRRFDRLTQRILS